MKTGEIYFTKSVEGKTTGAVFMGSGEFSLNPPVDVEKKNLAIFTDKPEVKASFDGLTMFFTDETLSEIRGSPNAQMGKAGPQAEKARAAFRDKEDKLRRDFHYNITSRILADIYAPQRKGFFTAFIDGKNFGKLVFQLDPLELKNIALPAEPKKVAVAALDDVLAEKLENNKQ